MLRKRERERGKREEGKKGGREGERKIGRWGERDRERCVCLTNFGSVSLSSGYYTEYGKCMIPKSEKLDNAY